MLWHEKEGEPAEVDNLSKVTLQRDFVDDYSYDCAIICGQGARCTI